MRVPSPHAPPPRSRLLRHVRGLNITHISEYNTNKYNINISEYNTYNYNINISEYNTNKYNINISEYKKNIFMSPPNNKVKDAGDTMLP